MSSILVRQSHQQLGFCAGFFHRSSLGRCFFVDDNLELHGHVLVQLHRHVELADMLQRLIQLDFAAIDRHALMLELVCDVSRGHRAKELIALARLAGEAYGHALDLLRQSLSIALLGGSPPHRRGLHLLDDGAIGVGGFNRQLLRDEIVAAVALGDLHHFAAGAELRYVFFQNDFHENSVLKFAADCAARRLSLLFSTNPLSRLRRSIFRQQVCELALTTNHQPLATDYWQLLLPSPERQQRDVARLLDGIGQTPLVWGAHAGQTARHNLSGFGDKTREQPDVLVVDAVDLLDAELANLLATEELPSAATTTAGTSRAATGPRTGSRSASRTVAASAPAASAFARSAA